MKADDWVSRRITEFRETKCSTVRQLDTLVAESTRGRRSLTPRASHEPWRLSSLDAMHVSDKHRIHHSDCSAALASSWWVKLGSAKSACVLTGLQHRVSITLYHISQSHIVHRATMSNDWWGSPANVATPPRQVGRSSLSQSHAHGYTPSRFNDELDAEDARMADGVKFLPSFSTSTAGKLLGGGGGGGSSVTPGGGLGMSSGSTGGGGPGSPGGFSPPGMSSRRSPNTRFGDARSVYLYPSRIVVATSEELTGVARRETPV